MTGMGKRLWVPVKIYWRIYSRCRSMTVDSKPNERGTYNAWFCRRWPWHRGEHRDTRYGVTWS